MAKARLTAQAAYAPGKIKETWDDFVKQAYPWTLVAADRQAQEAKKILQEEKPMLVRAKVPLKGPGKYQSELHARSQSRPRKA